MVFIRALSSSVRRFAVSLLSLAFALPLSFPLHAQQSDTIDSLPLPSKGGVYALDKTEAAGKLVRLHPVEIKLNGHIGSNLARGMVYSGPRSTAEINGINADTHLRSAGVSFLVRVSDDEDDHTRDHLAIIRLKQTATSRIVSTHSQNVWGGGHKRRDDVIEISKNTVGDGFWVRLTPVKPLEPGEYGIVVLPVDANLLPGSVYDFDVDFDIAKPEQK